MAVEPESPVVTFALNEEPLREAFERRSLEAVRRIAREAPEDALKHAMAASTDVGALARLLAEPAVVGSAVSELEPLAPLIARNAEHRVELLEAAGGALSADDVGALLGISRQAVDKRRRSEGLLAFRQGGDWRYPFCQFEERRGDVIPGLAEVVKAFERAGPWVALDFLLAADDALGGASPLQALSAGRTDDVARLLRAEAGDGFS